MKLAKNLDFTVLLRDSEFVGTGAVVRTGAEADDWVLLGVIIGNTSAGRFIRVYPIVDLAICFIWVYKPYFEVYYALGRP
jgi:hypothetical protein